MRNTIRTAAVALSAAVVIGLVPTSAGATTQSAVASGGFTFLPAPVVIKAGTELTFVNLDPAPHSVTSVAKKPGTNQPLFDSGLRDLGGTAIVKGVSWLKPTSITSYEFYCLVHPSMRGTLTVIP